MHNIRNGKSIAKSSLFAIGLHAFKDVTEALIMLSTLTEVLFLLKRVCRDREGWGGVLMRFFLSYQFVLCSFTGTIVGIEEGAN